MCNIYTSHYSPVAGFSVFLTHSINNSPALNYSFLWVPSSSEYTLTLDSNGKEWANGYLSFDPNNYSGEFQDVGLAGFGAGGKIEFAFGSGSLP